MSGHSPLALVRKTHLTIHEEQSPTYTLTSSSYRNSSDLVKLWDQKTPGRRKRSEPMQQKERGSSLTIEGPRLHVLDDKSRSFCSFCHAAKELLIPIVLEVPERFYRL